MKNLKIRGFYSYQSDAVKCRNWKEITDFYQHLDNEPMLNLVKYISENYSYGIFATTSMHTLCLAQTERFSLNRNILRIDFFNDKFEFNYIDPKKNESTGWKKICESNKGIETFEYVLSQLKWIVK